MIHPRRALMLLTLATLPLTQGCLTALAAEADFTSVHAAIEVTGLEVRARPAGRQTKLSAYPHRLRLVAQLRSSCGEVHWRRLMGSSGDMSVIGPFERLPEDQAELRRLVKGTRGRVFTYVVGELGVHELVRTSRRTLGWKAPELKHPLAEAPHNTTAASVAKTLVVIGGVLGDAVCVLSVVATPIVLVALLAPSAASSISEGGPADAGQRSEAQRLEARRREELATWVLENPSAGVARFRCDGPSGTVRRSVPPGATVEVSLEPGPYDYSLGELEASGEALLAAGRSEHLRCAAAAPGE